ncbi:MAG: hypothetical protein Q7R41_11970, partial [Phycisphaerales bacterium]|nr:hypothetical protein [Phycisphaerales bacterium]
MRACDHHGRARVTCKSLPITALAIVCALSVPGYGAGEPFPPYVAVDLGTLGGTSVASGINELGQVVGYSYTTQGVQRAFLWLPRPAYGFDRGMHDLGALPGGWSYANDINNLGQIVGASRTGALDQYNQPIEHAFLWDPATHSMTDLGVPPSAQGGSDGVAINDSGQIVGTAVYFVGFFRVNQAFLWLPEPAFSLPRGFNQIGFSLAADINESGVIAGWNESDVAGVERAYLWLPSPAYGLPAGTHILPGLEDNVSAGYGINDMGEVVGDFAPGAGFDRDAAFLWQNGHPDELQ